MSTWSRPEGARLVPTAKRNLSILKSGKRRFVKKKQVAVSTPISLRLTVLPFLFIGIGMFICPCVHLVTSWQDGVMPNYAVAIFYILLSLFWNGLIGFACYVMFVLPVIRWWLLRFGSAIAGVVTDKKIERDSDGDKMFIVGYSFSPGRKMDVIAGTDHVSEHVFDSLQSGDSLSVLHLKRWPKVNTVFEFGDYELAPKSLR